MRTGKRRFIQVFVILLIIAAVILAWFLTESGTRRAVPPPPTPVRVEKPVMRRLEETLAAYGNLKSANQVTLLPKVAGSITALFAEVGDAVEEGSLLAEIDREAYKLDLIRADAVYVNAASTWERIDRLFTAGNSTLQNWEDARAAYTAAEAQSAAAKLRFDWTLVHSPTAGVVLVRHINVGSLVAPDAGTPRYTVGSLDNLEVAVRLPEAYYPAFSTGNPTVRAVADSFPESLLEVQIRSVAPWIDPATRTFTVTCRILPDESARLFLRPGMLLYVEFVLNVREEVLTLPESALGGGKWIWSVDSEGRARRHELDAPSISSGFVAVPGEWEGGRFIVEGQHFLREGAELRILNGIDE